MSKHWRPGRQTVELRPSRIRRDPVREEKKVEAISREREIWLCVTGIVLFAVALALITIGISAITSHGDGNAPVDAAQFGPCVGGPNCVIDDETVRIAGETFKIANMQAPKIQSARCDDEEQRGIEALTRLTALLNSGKVTTAEDVREPDGELRTKVEVDGRDVGAAMVSAGLARAPQIEPPSWC